MIAAQAHHPFTGEIGWKSWLLACTLVFSCLFSALLPFGEGNIRISSFDLIIPFFAGLAMHRQTRCLHKIHWMLAGLVGITLVHSTLFFALSDTVVATAMAKNTFKLTYGFIAIGIISLLVYENILNRSIKTFYLVSGIGAYIALALLAEGHRPHISNWHQQFQTFMPSTPIAIFVTTFFVHFWANRHYFKTGDLKTFLMVQPAASIAFTYLLQRNAFEGFYIPFYICVFLPYIRIVIDCLKQKGRTKLAAAFFILAIFVGSHFYYGYINSNLGYYKKWLPQPKATVTATKTASAPPSIKEKKTNTTPVSNITPAFSQKITIAEEKIGTVINLRDTGVSSRLAMWEVAIESIIAHPVTGIGAGQIPDKYKQVMEANNWRNTSSIHSTILSLPLWFGLASLPFLAFMFYLLFRSFGALGIWEFINIHVMVGPFVLLHDMFGIQAFWIYLAYIAASIMHKDNGKGASPCAA